MILKRIDRNKFILWTPNGEQKENFGFIHIDVRMANWIGKNFRMRALKIILCYLSGNGNKTDAQF